MRNISDADVESAAVPVLYRGVVSLRIDRLHAAMVRQVIDLYPRHLRSVATRAGVRTVLIGSFQHYRDYSPLLRRAKVDEWAPPPLGVFVSEERSLYIRFASPLVIAHEYAHGVDWALGGGEYLSQTNPAIWRAFGKASKAKAFLTPHVASSVDEYFAEGMRAMVEVNVEHCVWPAISRARLQQLDPGLFTILEAIFAPPT